jgi:CDP-diglyceride synthetase
MPRLFTKTKIVKETPDGTEPKKSIKGYIFGIIIAIVALLAIGYLALQAGGFVNNINRNWQEIKFAYEKPSIVKVVRQNYQAQESKLDQSFMTTQKSSQDQLIDEVVKKLKSTETLK